MGLRASCVCGVVVPEGSRIIEGKVTSRGNGYLKIAFVFMVPPLIPPLQFYLRYSVVVSSRDY
jgi:hypothetical protein